MSLEGKAAVVTGGDSGIGHAISLEMGRQGAFVTINWRISSVTARTSYTPTRSRYPVSEQ